MRNTVVGKGASKSKWNPVWKAFDVNNNWVNNKTNVPLIEMRLLSLYFRLDFRWGFGVQRLPKHLIQLCSFLAKIHISSTTNYIDEKGRKCAKKEGLTFYVNNVTQTFLLSNSVFLSRNFMPPLSSRILYYEKNPYH